ncbi:hypothetical protein [Actinomadura sp. 21ATH]|uniref:hypothetical protein n=1 Tax=Actinomadura sp. 21ATH TaxID=1735444 RepID=UPI0035BF870D
MIEVIGTGRRFGAATLERVRADAATVEHGRRPQTIDALAGNVQIADRGQRGAMVRFRDAPLKWEPGSSGELLAPRPCPRHAGGRDAGENAAGSAVR